MVADLSTDHWVMVWQNSTNEETKRLAFSEIVKQNQGFLTYSASLVRDRRSNTEDFKNHAILTLPRKLSGFDPTRGVKFLTYWATRIRADINSFNETVGCLKPYHNPKPHYHKEQSLNKRLFDGSEPINDIKEHEKKDPDESNKYTHELFRHLEPQEKEIVKYYYGIGGGAPHTLKEVGERLGVTRERARQKLKIVMTKLKGIITRKSANNDVIYLEIKAFYNLGS